MRYSPCHVVILITLELPCWARELRNVLAYAHIRTHIMADELKES